MKIDGEGHLPVVGIDVLAEECVGEGGFLTIRRLKLANVRADGSRSKTYVVDFLDRPKGIDAVVVVLWHRSPTGAVSVLLRDGLRLPLHLGRPATRLVVPDARSYLYFREVVAGIVEAEDQGDEGLRRRAASEVLEEAGYVVEPERLIWLGAGTFPSPGTMAERFFLGAVEIFEPEVGQALSGDGSPMEEGARVLWMDLDEVILACMRGEIEDAKSELACRRLRDHLAANRRP